MLMERPYESELLDFRPTLVQLQRLRPGRQTDIQRLELGLVRLAQVNPFETHVNLTKR